MELKDRINEYLNEQEEKKGKGMDVKEAIKALIDTPASDSNEDQGKFVQLLKGIAFSDDPASDKFMMKLMKMVDDSFAMKE